MSYNNRKYYNNNLSGKSTFQNNAPDFVPPPPQPPSFFIPPVPEWPDELIVKQFEKRLPKLPNIKSKPSTSISSARDEIHKLVLALNEIKMKEKMLSEKLYDLTNEEWRLHLNLIEENKALLSKILSNVKNLNTDVLKKLLAKRSAKRARQKRQRIEKKKLKDEWMKQNKEKSRKIDDYLQKFQDDINKTKQKEEAKIQADIVLRETLHKMQDAKKYIVKLDALVKLRRARQNTAKGRGENVCEKEMEVFENNIEKLKSLWTQRLALYKKEETDLRAKLKHDSEGLDLKTNEMEREVRENLAMWTEAMFGGTLPQVDFAGDIGRFVAVRSQWDQYLDSEGSCIPIGWVPPTSKTSQQDVAETTCNDLNLCSS